MADPVNYTPDPSNPNPTKLSPDAVIAQLRTIRSQMDAVEPLSNEQRKLVKQRVRALTKPVVEASINVIGVLDNVSQAIGQPLDEIRQLQDDSLRCARPLGQSSRRDRVGVGGVQNAGLAEQPVRRSGGDDIQVRSCEPAPRSPSTGS